MIFINNNFALLITAFFTAGSSGFINYFILEKLGILILKKSNEQDKKHFLLFFSLFNYMLYLLIYLFINNNFVNLQELFIISISIILTLLLTMILSLFFFPFIASTFNKLINYLRIHNDLSRVEHRSPRSIIFDNKNLQSVYIFDFNKELISSGYLDSYSNESDYYESILVPFDEESSLDTFNKVRRFAESDKDAQILLDFEKKLQFFVFNN